MTMPDLPHIAAEALETPSLARLALPPGSSHPPRILILYPTGRMQSKG
jgi:arsenic resistance protein ArsH